MDIFTCIESTTMKMFNLGENDFPIIVISVLLLFGSCRPSSKVSSQLKEPSPRDAILLTSIDKYKAYQTFDESKMEGVGTPQCQPFVLVFQRNDTALVRLSTDTTSIIMYVRKDSFVTSHQELPAIMGPTYGTKSSTDPHPRIYDRWIHNDTIIELCRSWMNGNDTIRFMYIKYPTKCYSIYFKDKDNQDAALRKILTKQFQEIVNDTTVKRRYLRAFDITQDVSYVYFKSDDGEMMVFRKNCLGKLALQPGLENYDKELSK